MLSELGLRNFKAFGDKEQKAPMAPITLIYGPNSGGKSSIIQALLMLKQSLYSTKKLRSRIELIPRGEYVDLGSFSALLHKHDTTRELGIGVTFSTIWEGEHGPIRGSSMNEVQMTFVSVSKEKYSEPAERDASILSKVNYQIIDNDEVLLNTRIELEFGRRSQYWNTSQLTITGVRCG